MIDKEIGKIKSVISAHYMDISNDKAYDYLICSAYCLKDLDYNKNHYDLKNQYICDGKNDGGIDFIYYDDDNSKIVIGQNKFSENIKVNDVVSEIEKMINTLEDFSKNNTSTYNREVKKLLRNALDRLPDESEGNIEIIFASKAKFNEKNVLKKLENNSSNTYSEISFINEEDLNKLITDISENLDVIPEFKFEIDRSKNFLEYESENYEGIIVNVNANSLKSAFEKFESEGLFNLNIRRYIRSKSVDDAIVASIKNDPSDFWFLNNGITIACNDFFVDGDNVKVYDFSIVNGGQTTTLIAKYLNNLNSNMFLMCKIIKSTEDLDTLDSMKFFNNIAEATNSQKPIQPKDLKANAPEMIRLHRLLLESNIFLEIKRGIGAPRKYENKINNEQFAQIYYSFVHQKPGTSRSNKKSLFSNNNHYKSIFYTNFSKDKDKTNFIVDLIDLNKRVDNEIQNIKELKELNLDQMNILSNAKQHIIAIIGFIYRIINNDINFRKEFDLSSNDFKFGEFLSNYELDDINDQINDLIVDIVLDLTDTYEVQYERGYVTSPSNFFKTDKKYHDVIIKKYKEKLIRRNNEQEVRQHYTDLLKR